MASARADPNMGDLSGATGTPLKLGCNRGWGHSRAQKTCYLQNGARYDLDYNDGLIGSRIHAFDWMTLNGRNVLPVCNVHVQ